ncbi:MAG: sugar phosphate isomerase/epimerase family protein [Gammaproteobacteria bacterium]
MQLQLFKTLWGFNGSMELAIKQLISANMQGLEGPAPDSTDERLAMKELLEQNSLVYIAEICTAGSYVPERQATLQHHLNSLDKKLQLSAELDPLFVSCLGGCDAWPENQSVEFFQRAMDMAKLYGINISFETHRSRSFFNPWVTQSIAQQLPDILLTVDFSHWCVVCERLMDSEIDIIHSIADKVHHIHARVGYEQGPQVPDPRAPEYEYALRSHQAWWEIIWQSHLKRDFQYSTMTPEFGPDGYLHEQPFTQQPVADLWDLNCWMAQEEGLHFSKYFSDKKY